MQRYALQVWMAENMPWGMFDERRAEDASLSPDIAALSLE